VNARGLLSKIDVLREYAVERNLHIIGIAETFLDNRVDETEISIYGYKSYRKDRYVVKEGRQGGVILYVREDIVSYEVPELNGIKAEAVWCKIKTIRNSEVVVGVCYKSQAADGDELRELYMAISNASRKQVLIMGDFNFPNINWVMHESDTAGSEFRDLIMDNYLVQHVKFPTRENNILDLVLTSEVGMVDKVGVIEHLGNSDHNIIVWKLLCDASMGKSKQQIRLFHKANYEEMRLWFQNIDWNREMGELDIEEKWKKFCSVIEIAVKKSVPIGKAQSKKYPRWMNKTAKAATNQKSKMWIKYRNSREYKDLVEYKKVQNKAVKEYRKAKRNFERKLAKDIKVNPKSFYAYVRSKTKVRDAVGPLVNSAGIKESDHEEMCNILNDYFGTVFTEESIVGKLPEVIKNGKDDNGSMLSNVDITKEDISKRLKNLKVNKAPGVDEIVPRILIENADYLSHPLEYIYRESLETGVVPSEWKQVNVTPIYKKGPRELSCNYRPVSLTSHICKVLESIIRDNLVDYLHRNNLIRDTQHGFVKKRSCLTNLLEFLEFVSSYIDRGFPVDVIYLDFQKAFDKVPHRRLMLKINSLGISGSIFKWIENWLQDREQKVVMLGSSTRWIKVQSGVPQGTG
jgi:endonuclease/exonuclease/phosphatase family metal-dependent hydrolase